MLANNYPRFTLAQLPTPLTEMVRLRAELGENCPKLFIKRDDMTGLATGGNKTRKLEFLIGDALANGCDTVITTGAAQSNHCRQTAAAAVLAGLDCILVLSGDPIPKTEWNGNLLLDELLGAEVIWIGDKSRDEEMQLVADRLRSEGKNPYIIATGGSVPTGSIGYVLGVQELKAQLDELDESIDRIILTTGSGGTHVGVLIGVKMLGWDVKVEGMVNGDDADMAKLARKVPQLVNDTCNHLGLDLEFDEDEFIFYQACGNHAYGVVTQVERDALRLMATTEAIILDPVYTGRAFGEMVKRIKSSEYASDETILFWHTGGTAGLFAKAPMVMG